MDQRSVGTVVLGAALGLAGIAATRALARHRQALDFRGKTVLITGGSRGLGLVMARQFAAEGAQLAICARDEDELERAQRDLEQRGADVLAERVDVTQREDIEVFVEAAEARFGHVDVLVNNAGLIQVGPMEVMTLADYEEAMRIHFWAPLHATLAVLPGMRQRRAGRIVNISSIGGKISVPHLLPYSASKFALVGLSEGLRAELMKDGILVTTVCPGLMRTGSPRNALFKSQHRAEYAWFTISDSLPVTSISAESAARRVVKACRYGEPEVVLGLPFQVAAAFHGVFPGVTADLLGMLNQVLPAPGGIGEDRLPGKDSESPLAPSVLTTLSERAAVAHNQVG